MIVFSARIVKFVVESVVTGSAIGQSLLGSAKGVGQSGPFTVGNRPCDGCSGDYRNVHLHPLSKVVQDVVGQT